MDTLSDQPKKKILSFSPPTSRDLGISSSKFQLSKYEFPFFLDKKVMHSFPSIRIGF